MMPIRLRKGPLRSYQRDYALVCAVNGTLYERRFGARTGAAALLHVAKVLGISGDLTSQEFERAGGRKLLRGSKQIFPHEREPHLGGGK